MTYYLGVGLEPKISIFLGQNLLFHLFWCSPGVLYKVFLELGSLKLVKLPCWSWRNWELVQIWVCPKKWGDTRHLEKNNFDMYRNKLFLLLLLLLITIITIYYYIYYLIGENNDRHFGVFDVNRVFQVLDIYSITIISSEYHQNIRHFWNKPWEFDTPLWTLDAAVDFYADFSKRKAGRTRNPAGHGPALSVLAGNQNAGGENSGHGHPNGPQIAAEIGFFFSQSQVMEFSWFFFISQIRGLKKNRTYPLVNVYITMENHHL